MPLLPAMALAASQVDAAEVYAAGLFDPDNPATSLEILNGGLDSANYAGGNGSIPPHAVQYGALACGRYWGSDNWSFIYARQSSLDDGTTPRDRVRIVHSELCANFYLPWQATMVLFGWQAFMCTDCLVLETNQQDPPATYLDEEHWTVFTYLDGSRIQAMDSRIPPTNIFTGTLPEAPAPWPDPLSGTDDRFRTPSKVWQSGNVAEGNHSIRVSVWCKVATKGFHTGGGAYTDVDEKQIDPYRNWLVTPSSGIWMVAFR